MAHHTPVLAAVLAACSAGTALAAPKETVLFSFSGTGTFADGAFPMAGLVIGPDGSLYGTTSQGGASPCSCGTVFRLTPPAGGTGTWTHTVLHSFQGYPADGAAPLASLVFDPLGNLYGTTLLGGAQQSGTVFMLHDTGSAWAETVLHAFAGGAADGQFPYASLAFDTSGALYGTTFLGGAANQGMVFRLQLAGTTATFSVVHDFAGGKDGAQPFAGVVFDGQGNLYGATSSDGISGVAGGTAFRIAPGGAETVLHTFTGETIGPAFDGGVPYGNLTLDAAGNLYGTTEIGGAGQIIPGEASDGGTVFRLTRPAAGAQIWRETLLHSFNGDTGTSNTTDGAFPMGGVVFNAAGSLFGTTVSGGADDDGTVFRLTPPAAGKRRWTQTALHSFTSSPDGDGPYSTLAEDAAGNLYGTTRNGTASRTSFQVGTVFRVRP